MWRRIERNQHVNHKRNQREWFERQHGFGRLQQLRQLKRLRDLGDFWRYGRLKWLRRLSAVQLFGSCKFRYRWNLAELRSSR